VCSSDLVEGFQFSARLESELAQDENQRAYVPNFNSANYWFDIVGFVGQAFLGKKNATAQEVMAFLQFMARGSAEDRALQKFMLMESMYRFLNQSAELDKDHPLAVQPTDLTGDITALAETLFVVVPGEPDPAGRFFPHKVSYENQVRKLEFLRGLSIAHPAQLNKPIVEFPVKTLLRDEMSRLEMGSYLAEYKGAVTLRQAIEKLESDGTDSTSVASIRHKSAVVAQRQAIYLATRGDWQNWWRERALLGGGQEKSASRPSAGPLLIAWTLPAVWAKIRSGWQSAWVSLAPVVERGLARLPLVGLMTRNMVPAGDEKSFPLNLPKAAAFASGGVSEHLDIVLPSLKEAVQKDGAVATWVTGMDEVASAARRSDDIAMIVVQAASLLTSRERAALYRAVREAAAKNSLFSARPIVRRLLDVQLSPNNLIRDGVEEIRLALQQQSASIQRVFADESSVRQTIADLAAVTSGVTFNSEETYWKQGARRDAFYDASNHQVALAEDYLTDTRDYHLNEAISVTLRSSLRDHQKEAIFRAVAGHRMGEDDVLRLRALLFWGLSADEVKLLSKAELEVHPKNLLDRAVRVWALGWLLRDDLGVYEIADRLRNFFTRQDDAGLIRFLQEVDDATKIDLPINNGTLHQRITALSAAIRRARADRQTPPEIEAKTEVIFRSSAMQDTMPVEAAYPLMKAVTQLSGREESWVLRTIERHHKTHPSSYRDHSLLLAPLLMADRIPDDYVDSQNFAFDEIVEVSPEGFRLWGGGLGPVISFIGLAYSRLAGLSHRLLGMPASRRKLNVVDVEPDYQFRRSPDGKSLIPLDDAELAQVLDFSDSETYYLQVPAPILTREGAFGFIEEWEIKKVWVRVRTAKNESGGTVLLWRDLRPTKNADQFNPMAEGFDLARFEPETDFAKTLYAYGTSLNPISEWSFTAFHGAVLTILLADREKKRRDALGAKHRFMAIVKNDAQSSLGAAFIKRSEDLYTDLFMAFDQTPYRDILADMRRYSPVFEKTHTYANRQYFDVYEAVGQVNEWGRRMSMFLFGMKDAGEQHKLKGTHLRRRLPDAANKVFYDLTSSALRVSSRMLSVAAAHAANIWRMFGDKVIGMTNGSNFAAALKAFVGVFRGRDALRPEPKEMANYKKRVKIGFFEELLGDASPLEPAYRDSLRAHFKAGEKWNAGVARTMIGHVGRLVLVKFGKGVSSVNGAYHEDPSKDRAWTEENIRAALREGGNVVVMGARQATGESEALAKWLTDLQMKIDAEWRDGAAGWDAKEHGRLIFVPAFSTKLKELAADSIDILCFDSEENTEAAGFTEAGRGKSIYVTPANPKQEGLFDNQGLPWDGQGHGNYLKTEDTSPASWRGAVLRLIRQSKESPEVFASHLADSWRLFRVTNVLWTAHCNLDVINRGARELREQFLRDRRSAMHDKRVQDAKHTRPIAVIADDVWVEKSQVVNSRTPLRVTVIVNGDVTSDSLDVRIRYARLGKASAPGAARPWEASAAVELMPVESSVGRIVYGIDLSSLGLEPGDYEFILEAQGRAVSNQIPADVVGWSRLSFQNNGKFTISLGLRNMPAVLLLPGLDGGVFGAMVLAAGALFAVAYAISPAWTLARLDDAANWTRTALPRFLGVIAMRTYGGLRRFLPLPPLVLGVMEGAEAQVGAQEQLAENLRAVIDRNDGTAVFVLDMDGTVANPHEAVSDEMAAELAGLLRDGATIILNTSSSFESATSNVIDPVRAVLARTGEVNRLARLAVVASLGNARVYDPAVNRYVALVDVPAEFSLFGDTAGMDRAKMTSDLGEARASLGERLKVPTSEALPAAGTDADLVYRWLNAVLAETKDMPKDAFVEWRASDRNEKVEVVIGGVKEPAKKTDPYQVRSKIESRLNGLFQERRLPFRAESSGESTVLIRREGLTKKEGTEFMLAHLFPGRGLSVSDVVAADDMDELPSVGPLLANAGLAILTGGKDEASAVRTNAPSHTPSPSGPTGLLGALRTARAVMNEVRVEPPAAAPAESLAGSLLGGKAQSRDVATFELSAAELRSEALRKRQAAKTGRDSFVQWLGKNPALATSPAKDNQQAESLFSALALIHRYGQLTDGATAGKSKDFGPDLRDALLHVAHSAIRSDVAADGVLAAAAAAYNRAMGLEDAAVLVQNDLQEGKHVGIQLTANVVNGEISTEDDRKVMARLESVARLLAQDSSQKSLVTLLAPDASKGTDVSRVLGRQNEALRTLAGVSVVFEEQIQRDGKLSAEKFLRATQGDGNLNAVDLLILDRSAWTLEDSVKGLAQLLVMLAGDLVFNATEGIADQVKFLNFVKINA
jgi:hypothetical protein